jgi:hypothetical protein
MFYILYGIYQSAPHLIYAVTVPPYKKVVLLLNFLKKMNVFFRKVQINENTGTAMIRCTSAPLVHKVGKIAGIEVGSRSTQDVVWGNFSPVDPETGIVLRANSPIIQEIMKRCEPDTELVGYRFNYDNPVVDMKTGEVTQPKMYWVEQYDLATLETIK